MSTIPVGRKIDKTLAESFNDIAEQYNKYRTGYPQEVIAEILTLTGMTPMDIMACEIGCGTGHATLDFARKGVSISAVDSGKELVTIAADNLKDFPKVQFINSKFESAPLASASFDLVFAAQSFHWLILRLH